MNISIVHIIIVFISRITIVLILSIRIIRIFSLNSTIKQIKIKINTQKKNVIEVSSTQFRLQIIERNASDSDNINRQSFTFRLNSSFQRQNQFYNTMQSNWFNFRDDTQESRTQKIYQTSVKEDSQNENNYSEKSIHDDFNEYNDYEKEHDYNYDDSKQWESKQNDEKTKDINFVTIVAESCKKYICMLC